MGQDVTFSDLLQKIGALTIQLDIANEQIRQLREEAQDLRRRLDEKQSGNK
jgi:predicted  nucleic acid-binding Zn-ribbon protein